MSDNKKQKIEYRVVRTKDELEQAFSLVYKEYKSRGYIPKGHKSKLRFSLYNSLPSTTTFIAKKGKKILAAVSLIADSPMGLPMDKIYKDRCDTLRKQGRRIGEGSQLAVDSSIFPKGWFSMFNFDKLIFIFRLFKLVIDYALYAEKINDITIAINPKHQYLYKFIGFEEFGGLKHYGSVNRAPAIAKRLELARMEEKIKNKKGLYQIFFGSKTDPCLTAGKFKLSTPDLEYFFLKKSDLLKKATKEQMEYIKSCYPNGEIDGLLKKYE